MTKSSLQKDLEQLGFTKNLAKVYMTLVELGETKAGAIVKETGMHRHLVYTALDELEQKKLLTRVQKGGVARFIPLDPIHLRKEIERKQQLADTIIEQLSLLRDPTTDQQVIVYESRNEIASIEKHIYDMMEDGKEYYLLGLSGGWYDVLDWETDVAPLVDIHNQKKFVLKGITTEMTDDERRYQTLTQGYTEWRAMPNVGSKDTEITILYDRIFIKIFVEPYTAIEIINEKLAQDYRAYFETLWHQNTRTLTGASGARQFLEETLEVGDVYFIGGNGGMERYHPEVWNWYKEERVYKKVMWHDLVDPEMNLTGSGKNTHICDDPYYEMKVLPHAVASPHVICIYGDKVANIVWKEESIITITEDADVAAGYKKYFDYLWKQEVQTYVGWEELERLIFDDILPSFAGQTEYAQGAGYDTPDDTDRFATFWLRYNRYRIELDITRYGTMYEQYRDQFEQEIRDAGDHDFELTHFRYLPKEYNSPMETHVYGDTVVLITWQGTPTATVYRKKEMADSFQNQFELLWDIAKE